MFNRAYGLFMSEIKNNISLILCKKSFSNEPVLHFKYTL